MARGKAAEPSMSQSSMSWLEELLDSDDEDEVTQVLKGYEGLVPASGFTTPPPAASKKKPAGSSTSPQQLKPLKAMGQLTRILLRLIPTTHSAVHPYAQKCAEKEDDIKLFQERLLVGRPQPIWGLPEGWPVYVAGLCNQVMGRAVVTPQQLEKYITYKKGSSWKVNHKELCKLGLDTSTWTWSLEAGLQAGTSAFAVGVPSLLERLHLDPSLVMDPLVAQLPKVAGPSGGKAASNTSASKKKGGSRDSSPADKGNNGASSSKSKKGGLREELGDGSITSKTKGGKSSKDAADVHEQVEQELEMWKQLGHLAEELRAMLQEGSSSGVKAALLKKLQKERETAAAAVELLLEELESQAPAK